TNYIDQLQHAIIHFHRFYFPSYVNIASNIATLVYPSESGIFSATLQSLPIHNKKPYVPICSLWQIFLGNHIAISAYGLHHLIDIGKVVFFGEENILTSRTLQRL